MTVDNFTPTDASRLAKTVKGEVTTPDDQAYDSARKLFYGDVDSRPAALVRVADADDVSTVLELVTDTGVELAVRSGGHSVAGHSSTEGGVVIDVRGLNEIEIDVAGRSAWAGSGLTAAEYSNAVGKHGLGTGFGDTGSVGIGGITLGGGVGFLSRKHGLTIDSVMAAEIVTADGQILMVDAESQPDLFWAIRGGGGNFGVATRFKLALHSVDPFVGGLLIFPAGEEVIAGMIELSETAPRELSTIINVMSAPPMPFIPEELVGTTIVIGMLAWAGEASGGLRMMDRFRNLGTPLMDNLDVMPYPQIYLPEEEDYAPTAVGLTGFADRIEPRLISTILDEIESSDASMRVVQIRAMGGAVAEVAADATAFAHRDRAFMVNVAAFYETQDELPRREIWVRNLSKQVTAGDSAGYVGFLGDEGPDRVRAAYPGPTWDRLREIKARFDPDNLFRRNQNILPAR